MRKSAILLVSCVVALTHIGVVACKANDPSRPLNVLREIKVERATKLRLGEKLSEGSDFCTWRGTTCTFKPGSFGGAEMMFLNETESGLVAQFHFYYGLIDSNGMNRQIRSFAKLLGKFAKDSTTKIGPYDVREVEWSDDLTSFDLFFKIDGSNIGRVGDAFR
jgi:hypothetical protein